MKKKKYKRGDVVQLKSGGPKMIIDEVPWGLDLSNPNIDERDSYFCRWFKGSTAESGSYAEELLELVDTKNEKQSKENNARAIKRCKMDAGDA